MAKSNEGSGVKGRIFVSHTHGDVGLVTALDKLIKGVFGAAKIDVSFSSSKEGSGVPTGHDWYRWIVNQVRDCQVALVLLTPASVQKPWILWESGAVYGAAEALRKDAEEVTKVRPLLYQLSPEEVPSPLQRLETVDGTKQADIEKLLQELLENDFKDLLGFGDAVKAGKNMGRQVEVYLQEANAALKDAPLTVTEAAVQEWLGRLDALESQRRTSEVEHVHEWLRIAFGRDQDKKEAGHGGAPVQMAERPIDLRIHRRLGEIYQAARKPRRAIAEYRLAERLAPRDLFLLRRMGKALLDDGDRDGAKRIIDRIAELDPDAFESNQECAALKGRWLVDGKAFPQAIAVYAAALLKNTNSYYLCELQAQACLLAGKREEARDLYARAERILNELGERNVWTYATSATAAIVAGNEERALQQLAKIRELGPSQENFESIEKGLKTVHEALAMNPETFAKWQVALRT